MKRELKLDDYGKYYMVHVYCSNCGHHGVVYLRLGEEKCGVVECANCECLTARTVA
jgi:hypothetical protein